MSNPKRKVTDLLPSEAILISSYADLKVLDEFEKVDARWNSGDKATSKKKGYFSYPVYFKNDGILGLRWTADTGEFITTYPATDFIPTESDEVEVSDYWKTRCELAEAIIEACPCDPDITTEQIEAWKNYHEFIKSRNTPNQ